MSIQDFERRKALEQAESRLLERAADLFNCLQAFAGHSRACGERRGTFDENCICGYTELIKEIDKFLRC